MINRSVFRLVMSVAIPLASAAVIELLPKTRVAQVPFQFQVADRILPAGTYAVRAGGLGRGIRIQNQKSAGDFLDCATAKSKFGRSDRARLVFADQDGQYRLSEIWFEADGRGVILRNATVSGGGEQKAGEEKCVWLR